MLFLKPCKQFFENRLRVEGSFPHCRGQYNSIWLPEAKMKQNKRTRAGSEKQYGPRLVGVILQDHWENSNEPFARAFRKHTAEAEREADQLFVDIHPNTESCIDLKLMTRQPGRMPVGGCLPGFLTRDGEYHYRFVENASERKRVVHRNPRIYKGEFVNVIRRADGSPILTFNHPVLTEEFSFRDFCLAAVQELLTIIGLLDEEAFEQ